MFVMDEPIINESSFSTANPSSYDTTLGLMIGGDFSHDLARREKINERMKILQDLVPGCNKGIGKVLIVDQIINYTQSLQHQVEFLSMKLEAVNTRMSSPIEGFPTKESNLNGKRMKISGLKDELSGLGVNGEGSSGSGSKVAAAEQSSKQTESPKDYIHVRARRNQATDSPSLAERARREMINARMKILQDLVPGCNKGIGKVLMLDEVINYIQSLQHQVEFLSMKLEAGNTRMSSPIEGFPTKEQKKQDYGCGKFIWKDDLDLQLRIRSSSGSSTPQGSPSRRSIHPSSSTGSSESATTECSNCKIKDLKIKMLEARLEMERHPEDHACQSAAILHELLNEMENLSVE